MTVLKKSDIPRPPRRKEAFEVAELGGEVVLRQMTLSQYLGTAHDTLKEGKVSMLARVLADCVLDADDLPVFDMDEWETWGIGHFDTASRLYNRIRVLSGLDKEPAEKKTVSARSGNS